MKLTLEKYGVKYTVETEDDGLTIGEQIDIFIGLTFQLGYSQESIIQAIIELAESYKDETT